MKEEKEESFFKKIIISIKDIERYPELASKKWTVVLAYMLKLLIILALVASFAFIYTTSKELKNGTLDSYEQTIISNLIENISQNYSFENSTYIFVYISIVTYINMCIVYFINTAVYVILLGAFGYFTAILLRIRLRFSAMCKITIHSLTLPIILNMIYILIHAFTGFEIKYFEIMYIGIAYIYIITSILMIKSDILKNQQELTKIMQEQEKIRQELEKKKKQEEEEQEEKKRDKEKEDQRKKEKKEEKDGQDNNETPQGENA